MKEPKNKVYGVSKDGSHFCEFCPEVKAELEKFPEITLEVAIGNCVTEQDKEEVAEEVAEVVSEAVAE